MSVDYLTFNGTDEYLTVADNAAWDHGVNGDFSWVFELGGDSDLGLNYTILNRSGYYRLAVENGDLFFTLGDNQTRVKLAEGFVPRNESEFIALTFEHADVRSASLSGESADGNVTNWLIDASQTFKTLGTEDGDAVLNATDHTTGRVKRVPEDATLAYGADYVDTTTNVITLPGAAKSILRTGEVENGVPCKVSGTDTPAGIADTVYYLQLRSNYDNIRLFTTVAEALIEDDTGIRTLTDAGSGTGTLELGEAGVKLTSDLCPDGNETYHIYDKDADFHKLRFYRNGAFVKQVNLDIVANPIPADTDTAIYIGADSASVGFFKGWMNFAMNTDDVLTPSEISTLYNDGGGALDSDTSVGNRVLQFAMNIDSTDDTTVTDLSSTGVDGEIPDSSMSTAGAANWAAAFEDLSMGNPLVFTSTGQDTRPMAISRIVWQGGDIASTDDLLIVDPVHTDQIIIEDVANDSDQTHAHGFWPPFYAAHGIKIKTLDNGEVNVYVV